MASEPAINTDGGDVITWPRNAIIPEELIEQKPTFIDRRADDILRQLWQQFSSRRHHGIFIMAVIN